MKLRNTLIVAAAVAMVAMTQAAKANLTLAQAAAGGTISVDDKIFSGFSYAASGLTSFDPNAIIISVSQDTSGVDYLTWSGNISLSSAGTASADLVLMYIVQATGGSINLIDQSYTGSAQHGSLAVDETAAIGSFGGAPAGSSHLQVGDTSDYTGYLPPIGPEGNDNLTIIPPETLLYVTKDIALGVTSSGGGFITISAVTQSFHQVPEPTTVIAGALLLLPLGASTLRILRRNRIG
jgi:hypothetical protein